MTSATDTGYYMSISEKLLSIPQKSAVDGLGGSLPLGLALPVSMGFSHEVLDRRILTILRLPQTSCHLGPFMTKGKRLQGTAHQLKVSSVSVTG